MQFIISLNSFLDFKILVRFNEKNKIYRRVLPTVEPGYLKSLLPSEAPQTPENWKDIMADIERVIMPGVSVSDWDLLNDV